jgi:hypothetical protein
MRRAVLTIACLLAFTLPASTFGAQPAHAFPNGSGIGQWRGFDICQDPSEADMQWYWTYTPYWWNAAYLGGDLMGCSQPYLSGTWLNDTLNMGWLFQFTWVGPQSPCTGYRETFSNDPSTAYQQGVSQAYSAVTTLINLGVPNGAQGSALVYDLEDSPSSCQAATNAFINGWTSQLQSPPAQKAGVYGLVCNAHLASYASNSSVPDFIWGADFDGNHSTSDLYAGGCGVPNGWWGYSQRLKQYGQANWNLYGSGDWQTVDEDCANGPVDPWGTSATDSSCL